MPESGDTVRIHYSGRLEDGSTFDTSAGREPLEFVVGEQQVIVGLDVEVLAMQEGESRTVTVSPEQAYGHREPGLERTVDRSQLPEDVTEGSMLRANIGGRDTILHITQLNDDTAVLDANHPLAGHTLTFDVELVSVSRA